MKKYETLEIDGVAYKTTFTTKWEQRKKWEQPDPLKINAYIPGTISKVFIKEGDEVKTGDLLLILNAMKMANKITAPFNAKIKRIDVKEGDKVSKDALMIELIDIE